MRLVWVLIPLILIGIVGIQESFADLEEYYCDKELILIKKISNSIFACVKSSTADKLIERGWADKIIESSIVTLETEKNIFYEDEWVTVSITNQINEGFHYGVSIIDPKGKPFFDCIVRAQVIPYLDINSTMEENWELSKDCRDESLLPGKYLIFFSSEFGDAIHSVIVKESSNQDNVDFSIVVDDDPINYPVLAGIVLTHYDSLEYPEFVKVGDEFDVNVRWTFTEYDEEGNVEHQNIPLNTLTREIFDESLLQIKIPENIQMITDVSDWGKTEKIYYDSSYNFNSTFTTYSKAIPFDYTNTMHEQSYKFKLVEPFFPPFDYMDFGGLGFGKTIYHQDGALISHQLDTESINALQSVIIAERLGTIEPQYSEVSPSEVNWANAYDIVPKGINTPADSEDRIVNDELIDKSTTEQILSSYDQQLVKKKSGYDVLLASSLVSFEDDGREYRHMILEHYPAPTLYSDMIKYGWIDTVGFETNEFGIVTYLDEPHEKYTLNSKNGFYLEDWIPDNIPDGQKLLYAQTGYSIYEKNELINEKYSAFYNFVPINFVVDENTTSYDLEHNRGFRVSISYDSWQDEIEDILEEQKERHAEKSNNYGGSKTIMRDGEMVILFEGGYTGRHYENSIYWIFDDNYSINVRSHYYTLDELIPLFNSIMENN